MKTKMKALIAAALLVIGASVWPAGPALTTEEAGEKLRAGALLIDVRTPAEFKARNLTGATNIPLDTIKTGITNVATNKSEVILLHCRTGRRSGIAEKELRSLGYTNVFNIGSFEQAQKLAGETAR